ncbi:MAG: hypothetical protein GKS05_04675 [Nitrospirales bacterium]|nr:hypothetical protein [Nitrospirales bacterium]
MPSLNLQLKDIPDEGLDLTRGIALSDLGLRGEEFTIQAPLDLTVQLLRVGKQARAQGSIYGSVFYECVRCLGKFEHRSNIAFTVLFQESEQDSQQHSNDTSQEVKETVQIERFSMVNGQLELGDMLREQLILMAPMNPLCTPDCLGLCQVCRSNRNVKKCGCQEMGMASPFSTLRQLINTHDSTINKPSL